MFKNKNDYSVIIFLENGKTLKLEYVQNIYKLHLWCIEKNIIYLYFNIYNRRTRNFIIQHINGNFINPYPR
jgi:hypothetical protein